MGSLAAVEFLLACALNPGTYFLNAGVVGSIGDKENYLRRVLDACMFRVLRLDGNMASGVVDFNGVPKIIVDPWGGM